MIGKIIFDMRYSICDIRYAIFEGDRILLRHGFGVQGLKKFFCPEGKKEGERRPIALQTQILKIIKMKKLT